jgi:ADP-dependent phosphofructokinase/glucokinase
VLAPEGIVLGLGGTVDYEVQWVPSVLESLAKDWGIRLSELTDLREIETERDLLVSIIGFIKRGIGGERNVVDPAIIHSLAGRLPYTVTLGGTPVRAALVMAVRGVLATVHLVSTNDETRALLPEGTRTVSSALEDSLFPHLIVQYPAGASLHMADGMVSAARANRLIYTYDPPNEELVLAAELGDAVSRSSLFLISGINIFKDEALLRERLTQLSSVCERRPPDGMVIYEDAGFHIPGFSQIVREHLLPFIDVYSLNEDEAQDYLGRAVDLTDPAQVVAMMKDLQSLIPAQHLMVHTHLFAAMIGPEAESFTPAIDAAVHMASAKYHFGDSLTPEELLSLSSFPRNLVAGPIEKELRAAFGSSCAFSTGFLLDTETPTTIGLGDSFIGGFIAELAHTRG